MWREMGEGLLWKAGVFGQTCSLYWFFRMQDWVDLFPMHKCACEGDVEGVRRCVQIGVSPDERDSDSWAPLHYACW